MIEQQQCLVMKEDEKQTFLCDVAVYTKVSEQLHFTKDFYDSQEKEPKTTFPCFVYRAFPTFVAQSFSTLFGHVQNRNFRLYYSSKRDKDARLEYADYSKFYGELFGEFLLLEGFWS